MRSRAFPERRPKLSCGQPRQPAEPPAELACAQTPLAPEPAEKILGPPLPLLRVAFRARRHQVAVAISPSPDTRNHMVDAPHHRPQPPQAVKAPPALALVARRNRARDGLPFRSEGVFPCSRAYISLRPGALRRRTLLSRSHQCRLRVEQCLCDGRGRRS
jgi:hypothetical protein